MAKKKEKKPDLADKGEKYPLPRPEVKTTVIKGFEKEGREKPPRKIGILGTCPSRGMAPLDDLSWEIWTIGPGGKNSNRWDRLFEIHGNGYWPEGFREYLGELAEVKPPRIIYTVDHMPDWEANVVIPKQQLFEKYGRTWFTSSIVYAIALALEEGVTDLGLWGIDLESQEEYQKQFAGARHFIDLARLGGVNLYLPEGCGLLREPNPYPDGWETHLAGTLDAKIEYLQMMCDEKSALHGQLAAEINNINGEISMAKFLRSVYVLDGTNPNDPKEFEGPNLESKVDMLLAHVRDMGKL